MQSVWRKRTGEAVLLDHLSDLSAVAASNNERLSCGLFTPNQSSDCPNAQRDVVKKLKPHVRDEPGSLFDEVRNEYDMVGFGDAYGGLMNDWSR